MTENEIGRLIVDASVRIHMDLGPGLFEHVYETLLAHELQELGLSVKRQVILPVHYYGVVFEEGFRVDMIVEGKVLVELKSLETIGKIHKKQVLTYLRLTDLKLGFLLNFGAEYMRDGISRILNGTLD